MPPLLSRAPLLPFRMQTKHFLKILAIFISLASYAAGQPGFAPNSFAYVLQAD